MKRADGSQETRWSKANTIANIGIALAAAYGIYMAWSQGKATQKAVDAAVEAFRAQSQPVVKFTHFQWIGNGPFSCEHTPIGMFVYVRNFGGVTTIVGEASFHIFLQEQEIFKNSPQLSTGKQEMVLAPGEPVFVWAVQHPAFPDFFKQLRSADVPVRMTLDVTFRSLVTSRAYSYHTDRNLLLDCRMPDLWRDAEVHESITELLSK